MKIIILLIVGLSSDPTFDDFELNYKNQKLKKNEFKSNLFSMTKDRRIPINIARTCIWICNREF